MKWDSTIKRVEIIQQGSALIETVLVTGVLIMFMIGIPMMGSLVDLKQTTIQASRYAAWERTVHTDYSNNVGQIDARFFRHQSAPIRTSEPSNELLGSNQLWGKTHNVLEHGMGKTDQSYSQKSSSNIISHKKLQLYQYARVSTGNNKVLVTDREIEEPRTGSALTTATDETNQVGGLTGEVYKTVAGSLSKAGRWLSPDGWGHSGPRVNGLMRSRVEVSIANNRFFNISGNSCIKGGFGCFHESTAIMTDGWAAADPDIIRERVHGFVPTNRLEKVGNILSNVSVVPMLKDLGNLENSLGCVKLGVRPSKEINGRPVRYKAADYKDDC